MFLQIKQDSGNKIKMQVSSWKKKKFILHKVLTQFFTVRILVYLSKSPFSPAEGDIMFPELQI